MKLTFEPNLDYQQAAIKAVTGLFEGQPVADSVNEFALKESGTLDFTNAIANQLILSEGQILKNLQAIQTENEMGPSAKLEGMHFSVEMETGTGKTYVYLRTIYELHRQYGFKKFVVVVPSIAIREGVLKNLQITHEHFQNLYDNIPLHFQVYDSNKVSALRGFATGNNIEVLVINIDSFAKDENIINKPNDKLNGREPITFIQAVNPIVIVDEPQNMETEKRAAAINRLNPLCTLRYSATHRNRYNLVYSLNPVKAYDLGLVKRIEVDSVMEENAFNDAFVSLESITATKTRVTAKIIIHINDKDGVKTRAISVRAEDDLYKLSNEREIYKNGYIVEEIDAANGCISLSNGAVLYQGQAQGSLTDDVMKFQIRRTVEEHLKKEISLKPKGIKVLSLFFIDRVANYRSYDTVGNPKKGKFSEWFEKIYRELIARPAYKALDVIDTERVHNGYFSQDKQGKIKDTNGETQADDDTYSLIMRDKERLLDIDNPLRFIFSHSALREGWDNPNVFQICTLNETKSEIKKRQEIGRGLRLPVNQEGLRIYDQNINRLTVIANESYEDFAKALQQEIETDCGVAFNDRIRNKHERKTVKYRKGFEADPRFLEIWEKLKCKTTYRVNYNTAKLIEAAAEEMKALPGISAPSIRSTKVKVTMNDDGVDTQYLAENRITYDSHVWKVPDVLGCIQSKTELTRSTIMAMLERSGRLGDVLKNPQLFLDMISAAVKRVLYGLMIDGIKYEKIGHSEYEMKLFEAQELEIYLNDFTFKVGSAEASGADKTIYEEYVPLDSAVESQFAEDCETSEQVKFYFKLPDWFKIPTPIGNYNPDWAVVFEDDKKVYFVAETKDTGTSTIDLLKLRESERQKIKCGKAHFKAFDGLEYRVISRLNELSL